MTVSPGERTFLLPVPGSHTKVGFPAGISETVSSPSVTHTPCVKLIIPKCCLPNEAYVCDNVGDSWGRAGDNDYEGLSHGPLCTRLGSPRPGVSIEPKSPHSTVSLHYGTLYQKMGNNRGAGSRDDRSHETPARTGPGPWVRDSSPSSKMLQGHVKGIEWGEENVPSLLPLDMLYFRTRCHSVSVYEDVPPLDHGTCSVSIKSMHFTCAGNQL